MGTEPLPRRSRSFQQPWSGSVTWSHLMSPRILPQTASRAHGPAANTVPLFPRPVPPPLGTRGSFERCGLAGDASPALIHELTFPNLRGSLAPSFGRGRSRSCTSGCELNSGMFLLRRFQPRFPSLNSREGSGCSFALFVPLPSHFENKRERRGESWSLLFFMESRTGLGGKGP